MNRAYSGLTIKSFDLDQRIITGIASTLTPDRLGDVVVPSGATFASSIPLLLHHNATLPVGHASLNTVGDAITFQASFPDPATIESPSLRTRIEEAWSSVKAGLIRGVSIGFRPSATGVERIKKSNGLRFTDFEILELSLVSVPAHQDATIATIKSLVSAHRTASGPDGGSHPPGDSGSRVRVTLQAHTMKTSTERKAAFVTEKEAKVAKMNELMSGEDEGSTLDPDAQDAFDSLEREVAEIDKHLARLETLESVNKAAARPVSGATPDQGRESRTAAPVITVKQNREPGIGFARLAICKVRSEFDRISPIDLAKTHYPDDRELHLALQMKGNVPAGTTTDAVWANPLVYPTTLASEFIEFLRPRSLIGRVPFQRVPFNVRVNGQTSGGNGYWVGQGAAKPLTSFAFNATSLGFTKVAAISVITEELARFSSPSAETLVRDGLAAALIERIDIDLIDPAHAAVTGVSPASLTNGLVPLTSAGTSADNVRTDIATLINHYVAANQNVSNLVLILPETLAMQLSLMVNAFGQAAFPNISAGGGTLLGITVVPTQYAANSSGAGNLVIAVNAKDVFLADDGAVTLDASREASLQMSDTPTMNSVTGTATSVVSMFQTNSIALRAERFINWAKARSGSVVYMDDVNWGNVGSPA